MALGKIAVVRLTGLYGACEVRSSNIHEQFFEELPSDSMSILALRATAHWPQIASLRKQRHC